jgi:multidrug efflux pump subunit AcrA (membrane-fusion protein)
MHFISESHSRTLLCAFVISTLSLFSACSRQTTVSKSSDLLTIRVRKVHKINQPVSVSASGTVEAEDTAKTAFQVPGKVMNVAVQEGDGVRAGQLLASVDPSDYQHGAEAAAEQVAMAKSNLEQARVAYNQAADEYERMKKLYERKSLAPNDFKKFEAAYLAARERYQVTEDGAPQGDKGAAQAALEQAEAQDKIARKRLADTRLLAPINGIVARKMIDVGDTAAPGVPAFIIMNLNPAKVRVGVPEAEIGKVKVGQSATVQIPSLEGESFEGKVTLVGVAAEPASRTFTVEIKVPNPHTILRAGMIAEARIETDQMIESLTLPGEAVVRDPQGATLVFVYLPEQRRVFSRRVEVGSVYGREVEVQKGVSDQDLVVVAGQNRVTDGSPVNVLEDQP